MPSKEYLNRIKSQGCTQVLPGENISRINGRQKKQRRGGNKALACLRAVVDGGYLSILRGADVHALLCLIRHANRYGACWPSRKLLSTETGLSCRSISKATTRLADFGILKKWLGGGHFNYMLLEPPTRGGNSRVTTGELQVPIQRTLLKGNSTYVEFQEEENHEETVARSEVWPRGDVPEPRGPNEK